jgi:hypothetical protein
LNSTYEIGCKGIGWIYVVQDRDMWQAVMIMVMNLQLHKMLAIP